MCRWNLAHPGKGERRESTGRAEKVLELTSLAIFVVVVLPPRNVLNPLRFSIHSRCHYFHLFHEVVPNFCNESFWVMLSFDATL